MNEIFALPIKVIAILLQVYTILLLIRLVSSWFSIGSNHPLIALLSKITDPYLHWFRRFRFLRLQQMDFTPILAFFVLQFFHTMAIKLYFWHEITLIFLLSMLIEQIWAAIRFILLFYAVLAGIRFFSLRFYWKGQALWNILDLVLEPLASWFRAKTASRRPKSYPKVLFSLSIIILIFCIGGNLGLDALIFLINQLSL